jgi:deoxyadenosine/deoxycytidine kinase
LTVDPYDDRASPQPGDRGVYVALSGNTSGGKSSLISALAAAACQAGLPCVGISERLFHNRFLRLMFSRPEDFAFPIQVSFMLERHMLLLRNLELGRVVVIERPHMDDAMFVREQHERGNVSQEQLEAHMQLASVLHERLPLPDLLVLVNPDPDVSIRRLAAAEERGQRPREFPDDAARDSWVRSWHRHYLALHEEYRARAASDPAFARVRLIEADTLLDPEQLAANLLPMIYEKTCLTAG